jgi:uncharacterized membrane protein YphA (DoxX/SURF4 family)
MSLDHALRLTEILLGAALLQQSLEHLSGLQKDRPLFAARIVFCIILMVGIATPFALAGLAILSLVILHRFQGPYNGGADRMGLLALWCLAAAHFLPQERWREIAFGYLGVQLTLSYFVSGWVKVMNPDWRSGRALRDVFQFSAYPVSENLRRFADEPNMMFAVAWSVILLELAFPFALLSQPSLIAALSLAALFHLANGVLFGLNRFFWTWLSVYPALVWLQDRIF